MFKNRLVNTLIGLSIGIYYAFTSPLLMLAINPPKGFPVSSVDLLIMYFFSCILLGIVLGKIANWMSSD